MECQYCKKICSTKSNLVKHQTKTKYCLKIQGVKPKNTYVCKYCDREFIRKNSYCSHLATHEKNEEFMKYQYQLEKLREINRNLESLIEIKEAENKSLKAIITKQDTKILQFEDRLENIASKPTTVNNNSSNTMINIMNILKDKEPLSLEHSSKLVESITPEVINNPDIVQAYGNVFLNVIGKVPVIRDRSRGKTISKVDKGIAQDMNICKLIKDEYILNDYYLKCTLKQMIPKEIADQIKANIMRQSVIEREKTNQIDLQVLSKYSEQIKMFQGIAENEITDTMEKITRLCIRNLSC